MHARVSSPCPTLTRVLRQRFHLLTMRPHHAALAVLTALAARAAPACAIDDGAWRGRQQPAGGGWRTTEEGGLSGRGGGGTGGGGRWRSATRFFRPPPIPPTRPSTARLHALIIAGSSGYGNYRHQADAAHAYHVLRAHGVPSDNMILMSADDAGNAKYNPFPGSLYNAPPPSTDVRAGAPVDYSGDDVNAATFLAVLLGDSEGAAKLAPNSTRHVVTSDASSHLFVFYVDHGAPGLLGMPFGPPLFAPDLAAALGNMTARRDAVRAGGGGLWTAARRWLAPRGIAAHRHHGGAVAPGTATFDEAVVFIEACESGSMFDGFLPPLPPPRRAEGDSVAAEPPVRPTPTPSHIGDGVFVLTAANNHESSWGTYCPTPDASDPALDAFQTCLGDLFAVSWMEEADRMLSEHAPSRLSHETLRSLFAHVRAATSRNHTYDMGSHVHGFGDATLESEPVDDFIGEPVAPAEGDGASAAVARTSDGGHSSTPPPRRHHHTLPAADADTLHARLAAAAGDADAAADLAARAAAAAAADAIIAAVGAPPTPSLTARPPGSPAVADWGCLRAAVGAWEDECGVRVSRHVTRVGRALAAACNTGAGADAVVDAVVAACGDGLVNHATT